MRCDPDDPRRQAPAVGELGAEHDRAGGPVVVFERSVGCVQPLDLPGDPSADTDPGGPLAGAELPLGTVGVRLRVKARRRTAEVAFDLCQVADLPFDPLDCERADVVAVVAATQQRELSAPVQDVQRVDGPCLDLVATSRRVLKHEGLAAKHGAFDLRQPRLRGVVAGGALHGQADGHRVAVGERVGASPRQLLQREAQRLGVRELAVQQRQGQLHRGALTVAERDLGQVKRFAAQRVVLGFAGGRVDGPVDAHGDAERLQLEAVGVEAACERVFVHRCVAFDVAADRRRADGPPLGHQVGQQR